MRRDIVPEGSDVADDPEVLVATLGGDVLSDDVRSVDDVCSVDVDVIRLVDDDIVVVALASVVVCVSPVPEPVVIELESASLQQHVIFRILLNRQDNEVHLIKQNIIFKEKNRF
jgi:hypothetical protein